MVWLWEQFGDDVRPVFDRWLSNGWLLAGLISLAIVSVLVQARTILRRWELIGVQRHPAARRLTLPEAARWSLSVTDMGFAVATAAVPFWALLSLTQPDPPPPWIWVAGAGVWIFFGVCNVALRGLATHRGWVVRVPDA